MALQNKEVALKKLYQQLEKDNSLPLKKVATHTVPGEGDPNADILFIGEAPGKNEDEQGRPFVGAAGQFLNELIESIGLKREDVYIANIIKHRPPSNRDPLPEEIEAYTPYLAKQVEIIDPTLIVTLGRFSMAYFLGPTASISKIHGQPKRNAKGQVIVPMFHPAAALYRGDLRPVMQKDFKKIPRILELLKEKSKKGKSTAEQKHLL